MRNTLQNKKKCPTVNAVAIPSHDSTFAARSEPITPATKTIISITERRKPGLKGRVLMTPDEVAEFF